MMQGDVLKTALDHALTLGYRHIDTAAAYENEEEIGEVIQAHINSGKIIREDLFITTKIPSICLAKQDALESAHQSLRRLKVKYVDLLLIHHPWGQVNRGNGDFNPWMNDGSGRREIVNTDYLETWDALESLVHDGFAKHIGVSNFTQAQIERVLSVAKVPLSNVQLECHTYYQQHKLKAFCDANNIIVSAYAPMGAAGRKYKYESEAVVLSRDSLVVDIAAKYNKTPCQILLNFLLCRKFVVLPKSSSPDHLLENMEALNFELSAEDLNRLYSLDRGLRLFPFPYIHHHPEFHEDEEF